MREILAIGFVLAAPAMAQPRLAAPASGQQLQQATLNDVPRQAYTELVTGLNLVGPGSAGTAEATPARTSVALRPVALHRGASAAGATIRTLASGALLYPTGKLAPSR